MCEKLDLKVHRNEQIPGKTIELSGAEYTLQRLLGENERKYIYPVKNNKTGLILFVVKIYKHKSGSPDRLEEISSFPSKLFHLVPSGSLFYTEFHAVQGVWIDLQSNGYENNPEYCEDLMNTAGKLQKQEHFEESLNSYNKILKDNPNHSLAMLNMAICLVELGEVNSAIELIEASIELEPNFVESYRLLSSVTMLSESPEAAIAPLKRTLDRFNCDPKTWEALLTIAVDYDLVKVAQNALYEVNKIGSKPKSFDHFEDEIRQSKLRKKAYDRLFKLALESQEAELWHEAMDLYSRAMRKSKNNVIATLNCYICKYHLGKGSEIVEEFSNGIMRFKGLCMPSAIVLGMLLNYSFGNMETVKELSSILAAAYKHPADLPSVPLAVNIMSGLSYANETKSAQPIIEILSFLEKVTSEDESKSITQLKQLYLKRETNSQSDL